MVQSIQRFLAKYGFRCINELKLEEHTLHDDPSFVLDTIAGECVFTVNVLLDMIMQCGRSR